MSKNQTLFNVNSSNKNTINYIEIFISLLGLIFTILAVKSNNIYFGIVSVLSVFYLVTNKKNK